MIKKIDFFGFKILALDSIQEIRQVADFKNYDLVNIVSEVNGGFWRPEKIRWTLKIEKPNPFFYIASKKERNKIRKLLKKKNFQVIVNLHINDKLFSDWQLIYRKTILKKKRGIERNVEKWFKNKKEKKQLIGAILVYEKKNLKGGSLFSEREEREKYLSLAYSAYQTQRGDDYSYRSLAEYHFLQYGIEKGYKFLGHGMDTNLYGMHLSTGLFEFKNRYGYKPKPAEETPFLTTFFLNKDKFYNNETLFVYFKDKMPNLALLTDKDEDEVFPQRFSHAGLKINIFKFSSVINNHLKILAKFTNG